MFRRGAHFEDLIRIRSSARERESRGSTVGLGGVPRWGGRVVSNRLIDHVDRYTLHASGQRRSRPCGRGGTRDDHFMKKTTSQEKFIVFTLGQRNPRHPPHSQHPAAPPNTMHSGGPSTVHGLQARPLQNVGNPSTSGFLPGNRLSLSIVRGDTTGLRPDVEEIRYVSKITLHTHTFK